MANPLLKAIMIGAVAGMRSMTAPAVLAESVTVDDADLCGPLAIVADPRVHMVLDIAAGVELAADKTDLVPNRTDAGPLLFRAASGAVCGAAVSQRNKQNVLLGALLGGVSAVIAAHLFFTLRREAADKLGVPDSLFAVAEDAAAWGIGRVAVR